MTAIAGIQSPHGQNIVKEMLGQMKHRGNDWCQIIEKNAAILGASGTKNQKKLARKIQNEQVALEFVSRNHYAAAKITKDDIELSRDSLGISPLYYGRTPQGALCFASEVKGLLAVTRDVHELPPGYSLIGTQLKRIRRPARNGSKNRPYDEIARELRDKLEAAVRHRIGEEYAGAWLSGGIDSTAISAIARPHLKEFHTFTAGLPDSQDVRYAQIASKHIGSIHHTRTVTVEEIIQAIPEVIYHMESFDALLIRSSILNFLVAKHAANFVPAVFSGEGADELFAGYDYLHKVPKNRLQDELDDIIGRLHNTALQRVDRSASAHGMVAYVAILDEEIVNLAREIPAEYKIRNGVEKWILRKAVEDLLPEELLMRKKAKFWQGGGVKEIIADYADKRITDHDFAAERELDNGETLNSKEELLYYRYFKEYFGEFDDLSWMGRTKGAPVR